MPGAHTLPLLCEMAHASVAEGPCPDTNHDAARVATCTTPNGAAWVYYETPGTTRASAEEQCRALRGTID